MPRIASLANITSFTATLGKTKQAPYPLTNSGATDPTSQQWRDNDAPASYEWIPNKGIYVDEGDPITNMTFMFNQSTFNDPDITTWDTSTVTLFNGAFANTTAFNQDISSWDISNVTRMDGMFAGAQAFNQDISSWDTSNVTQMPYMFSGAQAFNQNLTSWNTTSMAVDTIPTDFAGSSNFAARNWPLFGRDGSTLKYYPMTNNGGDPTYLGWRNTNAPSSYLYINNRGITTDLNDPITSMRSMFAGTTFNDPDIQYWDVSTVTSLLGTFENNSSFNQPIGDWNTSNVNSLAFTFFNATAFNQNIGNWDVSKVFDMYSTFRNASAFNQDISGWDVSSASSMDQMFNGATVFDQDLTGWNNSSVFINDDIIPYNFATGSALPTRKFPLFGRDGSQLNYYPMTNSGSTDPTDAAIWRTKAPASATYIPSRGYITNIADPITNMEWMFATNSTFNDSDLQYWDVSSVTNMYFMFYSATSFNQDIGNWNVSNVYYMGYMFKDATSFNQDIGNWDVSSVNDMIQLFLNAAAFNQDLTGWCVTNITSEPSNFADNSALTAGNKPVWGTCP